MQEMALEVDEENITIGASSSENFTMKLSLNEDIR